MKKWLRICGWIVVGVTSLFFVQNGIRKITGTEMMINTFHELGFPDWFRIVVGVLELAGAIVLALPRFTHYAAAALGGLMIGAMATEMIAGQGFGAVLAGQWLVVLALIAGFRFNSIHRTRRKENVNHG